MNLPNIIGIIGTRQRNTANDRFIIKDKFFEIYEKGDWIVSGHCRLGGDRFAEELSEDYGIPILLFPPNFKKYGKSATFIRNDSVALYSTKALIACVSKDRSGGTEDTIQKRIKIHGHMNLHFV